MSTLESGDKLAGEGATAPRVTLASLNAKIIHEEYFHPEIAPHFTIAILMTENGFVLVGKSAPASPENFDAEKGKTFARDDALRDLWGHEGYLLREKLHQARHG